MFSNPMRKSMIETVFKIAGRDYQVLSYVVSRLNANGSYYEEVHFNYADLCLHQNGGEIAFSQIEENIPQVCTIILGKIEFMTFAKVKPYNKSDFYEKSIKGKSRMEKYEKSVKGKSRKNTYEESNKGILKKKEYNNFNEGKLQKKVYEESNKGSLKRKEYEESDEGKFRKKVYEKSDEGKF